MVQKLGNVPPYYMFRALAIAREQTVGYLDTYNIYEAFAIMYFLPVRRVRNDYITDISEE